MDSGLATVIAAALTGGLALIGVLVNKARKENATDHQVVVGILKLVYKSQQRTAEKLDRVDERLTNHLEFHASEGMLDNGRTVHQNGVETTTDIS
jgi:hypothetical protein